jgi:hypothetical protein
VSRCQKKDVKEFYSNFAFLDVTIDVPNYRVRGNYSIINGKTFNSDMGHAVHLGQDFILAAYTSDLGGTTNLVCKFCKVFKALNTILTTEYQTA